MSDIVIIDKLSNLAASFVEDCRESGQSDVEVIIKLIGEFFMFGIPKGMFTPDDIESIPLIQIELSDPDREIIDVVDELVSDYTDFVTNERREDGRTERVTLDGAVIETHINVPTEIIVKPRDLEDEMPVRDFTNEYDKQHIEGDIEGDVAAFLRMNRKGDEEMISTINRLLSEYGSSVIMMEHIKTGEMRRKIRPDVLNRVYY